MFYHSTSLHTPVVNPIFPFFIMLLTSHKRSNPSSMRTNHFYDTQGSTQAVWSYVCSNRRLASSIAWAQVMWPRWEARERDAGWSWLAEVVTPDAWRAGQSGGRLEPLWLIQGMANLGLINQISESEIVKFSLARENKKYKWDSGKQRPPTNSFVWHSGWYTEFKCMYNVQIPYH